METPCWCPYTWAPTWRNARKSDVLCYILRNPVGLKCQVFRGSLFLFKAQKRKVEAECTLVNIKRTCKRGGGGGIFNEWWLEAYNSYMKLLRMQQLAVRSELATLFQ